MAPTASRTPIWPHVLSSVIAALLLLLITFNYQLIAAIKDFAFTDYGSPCPDASQTTDGLPSITTLFNERPILEDLSPSADDAWEQMAITRKGGFLWVEFNETANAAWGISMFHALHCLKMLRIVIRNSEMMKSVASPASNHDGSDDKGTLEHPDMDPVHIGHCVGYIAQHLMCAADSTIEPPWIVRNNLGEVVDAGVDGEGYRHQCRDASLLWETAAKSEKTPIKPWHWQPGDTIETVFRS